MNGRVISCVDARKAGGKRSNFEINARYTITPDHTKDKQLNIRSVIAGGAPTLDGTIDILPAPTAEEIANVLTISARVLPPDSALLPAVRRSSQPDAADPRQNAAAAVPPSNNAAVPPSGNAAAAVPPSNNGAAAVPPPSINAAAAPPPSNNAAAAAHPNNAAAAAAAHPNNAAAAATAHPNNAATAVPLPHPNNATVPPPHPNNDAVAVPNIPPFETYYTPPPHPNIIHMNIPRPTAQQGQSLSPLEGRHELTPPPLTANESRTNVPVRPTRVHACEAHGRKWYTTTDEDLTHFKTTVPRQWYMTDNFGNKIHPGTAEGEALTRLDAFRITFPIEQMKLMITLTNIQLHKKKKQPITEGEMVKFFGTLILMTRIRCRNRNDLWYPKQRFKYQPPFNMADTGMSKYRWLDIWGAIQFSYCPEDREDSVSHADHRWMLIDDMIENFNNHRASRYYPSDKICVDESMVRWYGVGGDWINMGLPFYVALDRKPENGCEVQDSCDGKSGIMMRLKLVKKPEEEERYNAALAANPTTANAEILQHGTEVLLELVRPWLNARGNPRCVAGDSYFASVGAALKMKRDMNMDFIGPVKQCHKEFPKTFLNDLELPTGRGHTRSLVSLDDDGKPELVAAMWVDRDRKFFVGTCEGTDPGEPQYRVRWRQMDDVATNVEPVRLMMEIQQPKLVESYFGFCSKIDELNKQRQNDLEIEKYVRTHDWWKRLGTSILAMCVVDDQQCKPLRDTDRDSNEWFSLLAEEMIDNNIDGIGVATRRSNTATQTANASPRSGPPATAANEHHGLTPCKIKNNRGNTKQGWCKICRKKCITMCRTCTRRGVLQGPFWLCNTKSGRNCWNDHYSEKHA